MQYDLVIKNGQVVFYNRTEKAEIGIKDGKIAAVAEKIEEGAVETIDANGQYVMPGMVDTHCHIDEPGRTDWEGFETASKAFAAGGTTSFVDMPLNSLPATEDRDSFNKKFDAAKGKTWVDYGFYGGLMPRNLDKLEELADAGVLAFKAFTATTGDPDIPDDFRRSDDYTLYKGMQKLAKLGKVLCIHAENASITDNLEEEMEKAGKLSAYDYTASHPVVTELEAIQRCLILAKETGCKIHIVHVACTEGVDLIKRAQQSGIDVTMETCTHYLAMDTDDVERIGNTAKAAPPIRDKDEKAGLWERVKRGDLNWVTSDHSPTTPDNKEGNIFEAFGGVAGCQNNVDLLFDLAVKQHDMPVHEFSKIISGYPARHFNLHTKGEIGIGKDADIIFVDPNKSYVLKKEDLYYKNKLSPYIGFKIDCRVTRTILRGRTVFELGTGITGEATGRFLDANELKAE